MPNPSPPTSVRAARLAVGAIISYQILLTVLIFLRPDLDPSWHTISEWAIGRYSWIMSGAFMVSGLSYAALFAMLRSQVPGVIGRIGLGLLLICAIGATGMGFCTTGPCRCIFLCRRPQRFGTSQTNASPIRSSAHQPEPGEESGMGQGAPGFALDSGFAPVWLWRFRFLLGFFLVSHGPGGLRTWREYRMASTIRVFHLHAVAHDLSHASNLMQSRAPCQQLCDSSGASGVCCLASRLRLRFWVCRSVLPDARGRAG